MTKESYVKQNFLGNRNDQTLNGSISCRGSSNNDYVIWGNLFSSVLNRNTAGQDNDEYKFNIWMEKALNSKGGKPYGVLNVSRNNDIGARFCFHYDGHVTTPNGGTLLEASGDFRQREQAFYTGHQANVFDVTFPRAFSASNPLNQINIQITPLGGNRETERSVPYICKDSISNTGFSLNASETGLATGYYIRALGPV